MKDTMAVGWEKRLVQLAFSEVDYCCYPTPSPRLLHLPP